MIDFATYQPTPDETGCFSWSAAILGMEQELGREITPEEFGQLQDNVFERAIPASLNEQPSLDGADLHSLVFQLAQEHPEWGPEEIKNAVRRQMLDVMTA